MFNIRVKGIICCVTLLWSSRLVDDDDDDIDVNDAFRLVEAWKASCQGKHYARGNFDMGCQNKPDRGVTLTFWLVW